MKKLSVIIVNYNVKYFLEQALHSVVRAIKNVDSEVWVVDNNSVDGSREMVETKFPTVNFIANSENVGFSRANNQAILKSHAEYILLLNPDTVLQDDTLEKCIGFMDFKSDCGALGVRMIDGKGKFLPESKRGLPSPAVAFYKMTGLSALFPKSRKFGHYHLKYLSENENHEVEVLSGAFMMIRKSVLDKIGLLDESFFMYGEDIDLSYRITQAGFKNYYFSETTIIHYKGESTKKRSANYVKVFYNAMVLFAQKHYSQKSAGWFNFFIQLAIYLRAFLALCVRFGGNAMLPLADFGLMYAGYFGIARYWEEYNKYVRDFYPVEYFVLHIPVYILVVILGIFLVGGYDIPLQPSRMWKGAAVGALLMFAFYAFLPKELQFSRAILLLGCCWSVVAPFLVRMLSNFMSTGKAVVSPQNDERIIIVAHTVEASRIQGLLSKSNVKCDYLGWVSPEMNKPENYAGTYAQLAEIMDIYRISLVIFSAKDVSSAAIMKVMVDFSNSQVNFKIVPEDSQFVIGSNNRNGSGELFTIDVKFQIASSAARRKKRILDLSVALLCLLISPILVFLQNGRRLLTAFPAVFIGQKTWVSYAGTFNKQLPIIKPGPISPGIAYPHSDMADDINLAYARDYDTIRDLKAIVYFVFSRGTLRN